MKGQLIYLVGASGSGKDTLISHARSEVNREQLPIIFAHRYITRPVELNGENHICLSEQEFKLREQKGFFVMHWQSHGNYYGIGCEVNEWLKADNLVVVNGSRGYMPQALERYPEMQICLIETSPEKLKERLIKRGRESMEEIEERLKRASEFKVNYPNVIRINNDGLIEETKYLFIQALMELMVFNNF
jgi:ribose 1,5-bisphosphokinase